MPNIFNSEPDDEGLDVMQNRALGRNRNNGPTSGMSNSLPTPQRKPPVPQSNSQSAPIPQRKPPVPSATDQQYDDHARTGMYNAVNAAEKLLASSGNALKVSQLNGKVDHPYGDGKYSAPGLDTLQRLGAGTSYGGDQ